MIYSALHLEQELQKNYEYNSEQPLCKTEDIVFDTIAKYLDIATFSKLSRTCTTLLSKCENVTLRPRWESNYVFLKGCRFRIAVNNGEILEEDFRPHNFKLFSCRIYFDDCGDEEMIQMLEFTKQYDIKAVKLHTIGLWCNVKLFREALQLWGITELECYGITNELMNDPIMKQIETFDTHAFDVSTPQVLSNNFLRLCIGGGSLTIKALRKIVDELIEGQRTLDQWIIHDLEHLGDIMAQLFNRWQPVSLEDEHKCKRRPLIVRRTGYTSSIDYKIICKDEAVYIGKVIPFRSGLFTLYSTDCKNYDNYF